MTRNMRNFWLEASVDGRNSDIATGPRNREGGMSAELFVNENGSSTKALTITCYPDGDTLNITTRFFDYHQIKVTANRHENGLIINDDFKVSVAQILADTNIPPSKRLAKIKELL